MGTRTSGSEGGGDETTARKRGTARRRRPYLSILQRTLLQPNDFADAASLERAILDFERYYAGIAEPFQWRFTRAHLNLLLARVASEQTVPTGPAAPLLLAA